MASIMFFYDGRRLRKDGTAPLRLRITHRKKIAYIPFDIYLKPEQWDIDKQCVIKHPQKLNFNIFLQKKKIEIEEILMRQSRNLTVFELRDNILRETEREESSNAEILFLNRFQKFTNSRPAKRTQEIYQATINAMRKFDKKLETLTFEDITRSWLLDFDRFLEKTSPSRNARNIHLRNIRAVFNDAIDDEITSAYPFRKIKLKNEKTRKRNLTAESLRMLFNYKCDEWQQRYADMFKLSFLLCGINPVDMYKLKKSDINGEYLYYTRTKTGKNCQVKLEPEALELIKKYKGKDDHLLFLHERYVDYRNFFMKCNAGLKKIGIHGTGNMTQTGKALFPDITMYWARHSWATIAAELDIPKETIAAGLSHNIGSDVTSIYIDFNMKKVDDANRRIIDYILYNKV